MRLAERQQVNVWPHTKNKQGYTHTHKPGFQVSFSFMPKGGQNEITGGTSTYPRAKHVAN